MISRRERRTVLAYTPSLRVSAAMALADAGASVQQDEDWGTNWRVR